MQVNYFKASKWLENHATSTLEYEEEVETVKMAMNNDRYGNFDRYHYTTTDLKVGDSLEIQYSYTIPFHSNNLKFLSYRIFFHNSYYKRNYELSISYPTRLFVSIVEKNGATADSTLEFNQRTLVKYRTDSLKGSLLETNSRPYTNLPYVTISIIPLDYTSHLPNTYTDYYIPTYGFYAGVREKDHVSMIMSINQGVKMKQYNLIDDFYATFSIRNETDTSIYQHLKNLKNYIAKNMTFLDDEKYFQEIDIYEKRIGTHLAEGKVRDIFRHEMYVALLTKLGVNYYTAYLEDVRSGIVEDHHLTAMENNDYMFAIPTKNEEYIFFLPKTDDYGLYLNEYPFYYENTRTKLVHLSDYRAYKEEVKNINRQTIMPAGNYTSNNRLTNLHLDISVKELRTLFRCRIDLSGQYSTLTRGVYSHNFKDPTINQFYNRKLWDYKNCTIHSLEHTVNAKMEDFPYHTNITATYTSDNFIFRKGNLLSVPLQEMFNHIITKPLCEVERNLDYYSDFTGSDSYMYQLEFDEEVKLLNPQSMTVNNDYGEYQFEISQIESHKIMVKSYYALKKSKLLNTEIDELCELQKAIRDSSRDSVQVQVQAQ
jgi:hypothetical protein